MKKTKHILMPINEREYRQSHSYVVAKKCNFMYTDSTINKVNEERNGIMSEKECSCGHEHGEEMELETMTLTLDDDTEVECGILGVFEVEGIEGKEYIALLPLDGEEVYLYEYRENGEEIELDVIEDDADFEKVSHAFYDLYEEE